MEIENPAKAQGTEEEVWNVFWIEARIIQFAKETGKEISYVELPEKQDESL